MGFVWTGGNESGAGFAVVSQDEGRGEGGRGGCGWDEKRRRWSSCKWAQIELEGEARCSAKTAE
jgi:hypothetical protein